VVDPATRSDLIDIREAHRFITERFAIIDTVAARRRIDHPVCAQIWKP